MIGWLGETYLWVKAAHLIFVIFWMAGMFMLPRFFVYHHRVAPGSAEDGLWIERERRLLRIIINTAMARSEEHTSALQSLKSTSYDDLCLTKKKNNNTHRQ